ncbi:MAG: PucR family transcriptional regulator [Actinomycetes bacterium]
MEVPLRALLEVPDLRLSLAGGDEDMLSRPVRWVSITELADPRPWLDGGELVLTTGLRLRTAAAQEQFVQRVAERVPAGLGFGTGLSHRRVPEGVLLAALRCGLPVLEVPYETPFLAVNRYVADRIYAGHYGRFAELLEAHHELSRSLLSGRGLDALVATLGHRLGSPVSVIDSHGSILASDPANAAWPVEQVLMAGQDTGRGALEYLSVQPVVSDGITVAYLCARTPRHEADVLPYATTLVGLELARRHAVLAGRRELAGQVLEDLVRSVITPTEAERRLAGFGVDPTAPHTVLLATVDCDPRRLRDLPWSIHPLTEDGLEPLVTGLVGGALVAVVDADLPVHDVAHTVAAYLRHLGDGVRVGIGGQHAGVNGLRWSYFEARDALTKGPGVHEREPLDLTRLLLSNQDLPLDDLGRTALQPLLDFDAAHDGALVQTLQAYLEADCSVADVSAQLYVHRNTVRYRLNQVERLTGRSLASTTGRVQLWLALRALDLGTSRDREG